MDETYTLTREKFLSFVSALRAADSLISEFIEGEKPTAARIENYMLEMHHAMGEDNYGVTIDGFLEDLELELIETEDDSAVLLILGTANAKPKSRKRTPEVKQK